MNTNIIVTFEIPKIPMYSKHRSAIEEKKNMAKKLFSNSFDVRVHLVENL